MNRLLAYFLFILICVSKHDAQVNYGSAATYGLRKIITTYNGSAIQVRRACDNATANIGFTRCGDLDTTTLKNFVLAPNPLSAISSTAATAFSLRRLNCSYVGSAIEIRRSSDNALTNIGFTANGDLDTATMKTFIGANSAFVRTWYDQSGNGRHAIQTVNGSQPRIMNAGLVEYCNNRPSIRFLGVGNTLATANFTAWTSTGCFNGVARVNTNLTFNAFVSKTGVPSSNNFPAPFDFYNASHIVGNGTSASFFGTSQTFNVAQGTGIWTWRFGSAAQTASLNGASILSGGASTTFSDQLRPLNIGARNDGVTGLNGWCSEVFTFSVNPSTTDIKYIEWTQGIYYGIAGPILSALPASAPSASVATWYDQSGTGANASPTVTTNQPIIVLNGVIQRNSTTIPAISFNGAQKGLVANLPVSSYPVTLSALVSNSAVSTNGAFVKLGGLDNVNNTTSGVAIGIGNSGGNYDNSGNSVIALKEWVIWCPSSPNVTYPTTPFAVELTQLASGTQSVYLNGVNVPVSNAATAVGASITGSLYIGGYRNATDRFPVVKETEATVFRSALNTTRRVLLNSNQAAYHNLTITGTKYTPPSANTYNRFVVGIGRESTTDSVAVTRESAGMGFSLTTNNATAYLQDNGDYMTAGINCPITNSTSVANLPASMQVRWQNDWYIDKTDIVGTAGGTVSIYFDFSDYSIPTLPGAAANYSLLNRPTTASNFTVVAGATANVSGDRVYFTVNASNIVDNSYFTIGSTNAPVSPLPIELISFNAEACHKDVCLDWKTSSELNNDYFTIERSGDAENWHEVKKIKGAGTSHRTLNYSAMDYEPLPGISYYRLKQTDFDKNFKYSKIEAVELKNAMEVGIYPNPSNGVFNISNCSGYYKITITDLLGRKVYTANIEKDFMLLELNALEAGSYFITLNNSVSNKKFTSKIIIDKK
jgi:hypothetical protein